MASSSPYFHGDMGSHSQSSILPNENELHPTTSFSQDETETVDDYMDIVREEFGSASVEYMESYDALEQYVERQEISPMALVKRFLRIYPPSISLPSMDGGLDLDNKQALLLRLNRFLPSEYHFIKDEESGEVYCSKIGPPMKKKKDHVKIHQVKGRNTTSFQSPTAVASSKNHSEDSEDYNDDNEDDEDDEDVEGNEQDSDSDDDYNDLSPSSKRSKQHQDHLKKNIWSTAEDAILTKYVNNASKSKEGKGVKWTTIANKMGDRSSKQCRERWYNHLRPHLKKGKWTHEEDAKIIELQGRFGNKWTIIATHLPGRTDNDIKNRWHSAMRTKNRIMFGKAKGNANANAKGATITTLTVEDLQRGSEYKASADIKENLSNSSSSRSGSKAKAMTEAAVPGSAKALKQSKGGRKRSASMSKKKKQEDKKRRKLSKDLTTTGFNDSNLYAYGNDNGAVEKDNMNKVLEAPRVTPSFVEDTHKARASYDLDMVEGTKDRSGLKEEFCAQHLLFGLKTAKETWDEPTEGSKRRHDNVLPTTDAALSTQQPEPITDRSEHLRHSLANPPSVGRNTPGSHDSAVMSSSKEGKKKVVDAALVLSSLLRSDTPFSPNANAVKNTDNAYSGDTIYHGMTDVQLRRQESEKRVLFKEADRKSASTDRVVLEDNVPHITLSDHIMSNRPRNMAQDTDPELQQQRNTLIGEGNRLSTAAHPMANTTTTSGCVTSFDVTSMDMNVPDMGATSRTHHMDEDGSQTRYSNSSRKVSTDSDNKLPRAQMAIPPMPPLPQHGETHLMYPIERDYSPIPPQTSPAPLPAFTSNRDYSRKEKFGYSALGGGEEYVPNHAIMTHNEDGISHNTYSLPRTVRSIPRLNHQPQNQRQANLSSTILDGTSFHKRPAPRPNMHHQRVAVGKENEIALRGRAPLPMEHRQGNNLQYVRRMTRYTSPPPAGARSINMTPPNNIVQHKRRIADPYMQQQFASTDASATMNSIVPGMQHPSLSSSARRYSDVPTYAPPSYSVNYQRTRSHFPGHSQHVNARHPSFESQAQQHHYYATTNSSMSNSPSDNNTSGEAPQRTHPYKNEYI